MKCRGNAKGIIALIISQSVVKFFGVLYKLYLANKNGFGDEGNAIYNSGYQIYALLLIVSTIGVPNVVAKIVAENRNQHGKVEDVMKNAFSVFSFIGIIMGAVLIFSSRFVSCKLLNIPESRLSLIALAPAIYNVSVISVIRGYFNGMGNVSVTAKSQTIEQILKTICTISFVEIFCIFAEKNAELMAAWANMATTMATLGSLIYLKSKLHIKKEHGCLSIRKMIYILKLTIPISASAILASLNRNIDSITIVKKLQYFVGEKIARAQYGILSGKVDVIASVPVSFIIAISTMIIPEVANSKKNEKIEEILSKYLKLALIFVVPCSMYMFFESNELLILLFGSNSGEVYLKISAISLVFIAMEQVVNAVLQGVGKIYVPAISLATGVICKAILNYQLLNINPQIHWYGGIAGCCLATLMCHFVAFAISFGTLSRKFKINSKNLKFLLKPICASCIMTMTLRYEHLFLRGIINVKVAIIVSSVIAVCIYIILIFVLGVVEKIICVKIQNITKKQGKKKDFV